MLEKVGLPPKPSGKGCTWVLDASHCQSCTSQFSFFNRKHHCRRCGGLFCGNCTLQRMYLRGQGDAPVRICEPCKKIEEAVRFEARHGHRSKHKKEDDLLLSSFSEHLESTSSSLVKSELSDMNVDGLTPETLRQQARDEKKKYSSLKQAGKPDEALKAFKRGKELERQADTLALSLRRNSKSHGNASKSLSAATDMETTVIEATAAGKIHKAQEKVSTSRYSSTDDDLMGALKELGWSDAELHEKPQNDELLLITESKKPSAASGSMQTEILSHKKKALALKRQGNMKEAKEELRQAKLLEKKLEELDMMGEGEEEDGDDDDDDDGDEISAMLRGLEKEISTGVHQQEVSVDSPGLLDIGDDEVDAEVQVNDTDMSDPEMIAALMEMGWSEEAATLESRNNAIHSKADLESQILSLKRKALASRRAGNKGAAFEELKQAKHLEEQLHLLNNSDEAADVVEVSEADMHDPQLMANLLALGISKADHQEKIILQQVVEEEVVKKKKKKKGLKSKGELEKELLALKRKALTMRREGKIDEAENELKQAKAVEMQLEEIRSVEEENRPSEYDVEDVMDPTLLSALQSLGFTQEDTGPMKKESSQAVNKESFPTVKKESFQTEPMGEMFDGEYREIGSSVDFVPPVLRARSSGGCGGTSGGGSGGSSSSSKQQEKDRMKLQQQALAHKRRALVLRREGKSDESDAEFEIAKSIEKQMEDIETSSSTLSSNAAAAAASIVNEVMQSKSEIEERIKTVKRHALELKRAGQRQEAIKVYAEAKRLELSLQSMNE